MIWEKNPVLLLVLATGAILVGTIITMVLPFAWVNTEADSIASVKPYTPLELAGRDVYIREGCNNCHTQTVRPLVADVLRYGDYSKSGEFVYDRPHLWGSRRSGPDLARVGGKYPDEWHYQHMQDPAGFVPGSNMPAYGFLSNKIVDSNLTRRKMEVLNFPYTDDQIKGLAGKTEMDAIIAYMQKLGSDIPWRESVMAEIVGELENPYIGDAVAVEQGKAYYIQQCGSCHGDDLSGGLAADISDLGMDDAELFEILYNGLPDDGMPSFASFGPQRLWKIVTYINKQ